MSLTCQVQVAFNNISKEKAETIKKALEPDNVNFPKGLSLYIENIDNKLLFNFESKEKLNDFAGLIDRIMGSAQSLETYGFDQVEIKKLGSFAELCKQVGYRGANLDNINFFNITIAFLFDAVESMSRLVNSIGQENQVKNIIHICI